MKLLLLSARNLLRNPRRTFITGLAIAGGLALMVVGINLNAGQYGTMIRNGISVLAGHVVVQAPGWQKDRKVEQLVADADPIAAELAAAWPDAVITRRIWVDGLLTSPTSSAGVAITGVDPVPEAAVGQVDTQIVEGRWLSGEGKGLVVGVGLAKSLGVGLGDKVVYLGQHGDEMTSRLFRVEGIFRTGAADIDGFLAYVPLEAARALLDAPGSAHQVALHLDDPNASDAAEARVRGMVGDRAEVLGWRAAIPEIDGMIRVDKKANDVLMSVLGTIVAIGVLNTVLMSVMERVREFGVLMAIGMKPRRLASMILLEGLLLGLFAVTAGVAAGTALSYPLVVDGIDVTKLSGGEAMSTAGVVLDAVMYAAWDPVRVGRYAVMGVALSVLAAAWPAWRVTRYRPIEALHHR
ncbi:MAG: FtsX-like permease family protein [Myxococcota bacterium]